MKMLLIVIFNVVIFVEFMLMLKKKGNIIYWFRMILILMGIIIGFSIELKIIRKVLEGLLLLIWSKKHLFLLMVCLSLFFQDKKRCILTLDGSKVDKGSLLAVSIYPEIIISMTTITHYHFSINFNTMMTRSTSH